MMLFDIKQILTCQLFGGYWVGDEGVLILGVYGVWVAPRPEGSTDRKLYMKDWGVGGGIWDCVAKIYFITSHQNNQSQV